MNAKVSVGEKRVSFEMKLSTSISFRSSTSFTRQRSRFICWITSQRVSRVLLSRVAKFEMFSNSISTEASGVRNSWEIVICVYFRYSF